jgi:DNA-binding MarR family transcriptional regulator
MDGQKPVTADGPPDEGDPVIARDPLADTELTFLLGISFQLVLAEFTSRLDAAGHGDVRPVHGMIFQILYGGGATSSELAERLSVTKQASGQLIADLERRGYVRREDHPQGGRRRLIVLTDKALAHLNAAGAILHQLESEIAARAGEGAPLALRTELAQLIRAMTGDGDIPPLRPLW